MKHFEKKYRKSVELKVATVTAWLDQEQEFFKNALAAVNWKKLEDVALPFVFSMLLVAVTGLAMSFGYTQPTNLGGHDGHDWPLIGWVFVALFPFAIAIAGISSTIDERETKRLRSEKEAQLVVEQKANPLYQRAILIQKAADAFGMHVTRYEALWLAVDEGLRVPDEESARKYYDFLVRASKALGLACDNFSKAVAMKERHDEFVSSHPEAVKKPKDSALTHLLAVLDQPIEVPADESLVDSSDVLAVEDGLAEIEADLAGSPERFTHLEQ